MSTTNSSGMYWNLSLKYPTPRSGCSLNTLNSGSYLFNLWVSVLLMISVRTLSIAYSSLSSSWIGMTILWSLPFSLFKLASCLITLMDLLAVLTVTALMSPTATPSIV